MGGETAPGQSPSFPGSVVVAIVGERQTWLYGKLAARKEKLKLLSQPVKLALRRSVASLSVAKAVNPAVSTPPATLAKLENKNSNKWTWKRFRSTSDGNLKAQSPANPKVRPLSPAELAAEFPNSAVATGQLSPGRRTVRRKAASVSLLKNQFPEVDDRFPVATVQKTLFVELNPVGSEIVSPPQIMEFEKSQSLKEATSILSAFDIPSYLDLVAENTRAAENSSVVHSSLAVEKTASISVLLNLSHQKLTEENRPLSQLVMITRFVSAKLETQG
ncbi:hypothetical protein HK100_011279 [Physocladia obscura]|uniref:Uncharacterized protein n=1 Tax=Physocladia obscura TaxID=109957 RepID=A0AAD5T422_9FUNG|nr:hypothetical protein HK100_011279 [Physocladia obscura]